ncbi:nucleotide sugar dehydrogenase [Arthrobacter sp. AB6]|nr:nucleotide sugar dehydrogenase [Arthrobacter sp. AB6]
MKNVVVIGQGYVGLPLAKEAVAAGLRVTGLELHDALVENLNRGVSHVDDLSNDDIQMMVNLGYVASTDPSVIAQADVVVVCVPTPLGEAGSPDLGAVTSAMQTISNFITPGTLVILESTTYPGTTDGMCRAILESNGGELDQGFYLAFSPERIDPGNVRFGIKNTPKVVGGVSTQSTTLAVKFYSLFVDTVVPVKGAKEAETAKLLENTYRHINIALVNEMSKFCHELGIDLWNVIDAAKTKPFGFEAFYPGPGVGGHCIPIDPNYLSYEVRRSLGYPFRFVELAEEINNSMPGYVVDRIQELLNDRSLPLRGSRILLLGITYKPNIADQRQSPALPVAETLDRRGAVVAFHDPKVTEWRVSFGTLKTAPDLHSAVDEADMVVLLQNHSDYDVPTLASRSKIFFDTRGVTKGADNYRL